MKQSKPRMDVLKIVMGFSGNIDSVVGAYLLKKQGHDVILLGLNFYSEELERTSLRYNENGDELPKAPFEGVYQIKDLDAVKALADELGLPFYAVQAATEYQHYVTDRVIGARIGGRSFAPKAATSRLILEVLKKKAAQLGAEKVATGHYAKIVHNISLKTHHIFVSNDLENDQSDLLSTVDPPTLATLLLPLSDMRKSEVERIAKSLNLKYLPNDPESKKSLMLKKLGAFIEERAPKKLFKEGNIIDYKNDSILGEHDGIHHFGLGESNIKTKSGVPLDKNFEVIGFRYRAGVVYMGYNEDLEYDTIVLTQVKVPPGTDLSSPLEVFFRFSEGAEKVPGIFYPYNNRFGELKLNAKQTGLIHQGEFITLYNRKGPMGRVVASAEVRTCGLIENGKLRSFPKKKEDIELEEEVEKVDIYRFKH
jgi:tRNA-specific 2-thiouridylase